MSKEQKKSFVFYRSFHEAIQDLPDSDKLVIYEAITQYALDQAEPELSGFPKTIFKLIRPQIDANWKRYENGKKGAKHGSKGGRPKTPKQPQDNPNETPNVNVNDNVNEKENENKGRKATAFITPSLSEVADYISANGYSVNPEQFIDHYTAIGWKVGANPMRDWKATVRNWNRRNNDTKPEATPPTILPV